VRISSPSETGREITLNLIHSGEIFGEIALLDGRDRTADAIAMSDCELLVLNRRDFMPFLQRRPEVCIKVIELLCQRLRQTSGQVEELSFWHLESRLAKALLRLSECSRDRERKAVVTQKDLGNLIGMSRESTNRQLRMWEAQGWVRLERGGIVILSPEALERIAESDTGPSEG